MDKQVKAAFTGFMRSCRALKSGVAFAPADGCERRAAEAHPEAFSAV
ncbi:MAG: hypothetical protein LBS90_03235 [Oscillospiraceae bacterium]|nr:hypothetical protein [Oscillospiraceae bacterium]